MARENQVTGCEKCSLLMKLNQQLILEKKQLLLDLESANRTINLNGPINKSQRSQKR